MKIYPTRLVLKVFVLSIIFSINIPSISSAESDEKIVVKALHAALFELPASTAKHFNAIAARAGKIPEIEHMHFEEKDQRYIMLAIPGNPLPEAKYFEEYKKLEILVDGKQRIKLSEHPRLFSHDKNDYGVIRGTPTIVPLSVFPDDFVGNAHDFELLREGKRIYGPVRWLVPDERTGPIISAVKPGTGKGEVIFDFEKIYFKLLMVVLYLDARFDDPVSVEQVLPDGTTLPLRIRMVGVDVVGDEEIFREAYVDGFQTGISREVSIRLKFNKSGKGYFAAVGQAYTRYEANLVIEVP